MPLMTRMREMSKYFIIAIGCLFILFMIIGDTRIMDIFGRRQNTVGSINGKDITIQEFNKKLEDYRRQYREQNKVDLDDDNLDQLRDQLWDEFVYKTLTQQQIDKFSIVVSDKEVNDVLFGPNPPEFLKRQFTDSTGNFHRDIYEQALKDQRNKEILNTVKDAMKEQLYAEKLQAVINGAALPSAGEIKRRFIDQNIKMTADYAFVDLAKFPENTISVTNDEIKKYYEDHPEKFSVDAQRKLKFVAFPLQPTKSDSESIRQSLQNLADLAANDTLSLDSLAKTYAGLSVVSDSSDLSAFPPEVSKFVIDAKKNHVIGPLATQNGYALYQFSKTEEMKDPVVSASHILITGVDTVAAAAEAERIFKELKSGANFEEAARKYSKDPGSAANGGNLGWFSKGRMVPEFEKAAFAGKPGEILKPIKTQFGYHIIKVNAKNSTKFFYQKIADVIKASAGTKDQIFQKASDFSFLAEKDGFESEAQVQKLKVIESNEFSKDATYIQNLGAARGLISFAFDNSVNTISKPMKASIGYVVAQITEEIKAGVKKFDLVALEAKAMLIREKRYEKAKQLIEGVKNQIGGDIARAAQVNNMVTVGNAANFKTDGNVAGIGMDYNFAAQSYKAPLNQVIGPVKGSRGYYLIKVNQRDNFDENTFKIQYDGLRDNLLAQRRQSLFNQWLAKLKSEAKIVDKRYLHFQ